MPKTIKHDDNGVFAAIANTCIIAVTMKGWLRFEHVKKMTPSQFLLLWMNMQQLGTPFEDLIDEEIERMANEK